MITENIKPHYQNKKPEYHNSDIDLTGASDECLIELIAQRRDENAFNEILKRYRDKIFLTAYKITNNDNDAEDIVQEVSLTLYRKAHTFRMDSKFSTWLYRLTTNESISRLRRIKRRKAVSLDDYMPMFDEEGKYTERPVIDWSQEVEKKVSDREIRNIIENAIEELPLTDRAVVVLGDVEELTNPEIGEALGLTVPAVKGRLHRARLFLRKKLDVKLGHSSE